MVLPNFEELEAQLNELQIEPSQEELDVMERILDKLNTVEMSIVRAKRAGIEVTQLENQLNNTRTQIQRILREYRPR